MVTIPQTMRAFTVPKHGDASIIEESILPTPKPSPSELLIKVEYAGVNFIDTYQRKGIYPNSSWPMVLGNEAAGEVVQLPTDPQVLEDPWYQKAGYQIGTKRARGTDAEYIATPWTNTYTLPSTISTRVAAASLVQGLTALTFMTEAYEPQPGDWILVHTAAGGLGLLFTQIATARGAKVIGTTSTEEKAKLAKANGATEIIIYTKEDTVARVLEITGGEGVHAVFDGVGKDTWEGNFKLIRRKGTIVSVGNASGVVPPFPPLKLVEKNVKVCRPTVFNYTATPEENHKYITELWDLILKGTLNIKIHKDYPFTLDGIKQTHEDIVGRSTVGKLLVKVP
ncbi:NAD-P-binding protein [Ramaria rubella]|nr:NAD-P-binding protein [Ramaria rubella]